MLLKIKNIIVALIIVALLIAGYSKSSTETAQPQSPYNLDVQLRGGSKSTGYIIFRQDSDTSKIVTLETTVVALKPNHEYKLQRTVDTTLTGNCSSTAWLTLGKALQPQSIFTNQRGNGGEKLFRSLAAFPSGKKFDIHFQVIDQENMAVVLTSDCYQFTVR